MYTLLYGLERMSDLDRTYNHDVRIGFTILAVCKLSSLLWRTVIAIVILFVTLFDEVKVVD